MTSELEVDAAAVRAWAAALAAAAARISTVPPAPPGGPPWQATEAELAVAHAARVRLRALADDLTRAARQAAGAADEYDDADHRAATRMKKVRA